MAGHSLGGALASIFAALANKESDPIGMCDSYAFNGTARRECRRVDYLFTFGAIPISLEPLRDEQSRSGCFRGGRYQNVRNEGGKIRVDLAVTLGAAGYNAIHYGLLRHPRIRTMSMHFPPGESLSFPWPMVIQPPGPMGMRDIYDCGEDPPLYPTSLTAMVPVIGLHLFDGFYRNLGCNAFIDQNLAQENMNKQPPPPPTSSSREAIPGEVRPPACTADLTHPAAARPCLQVDSLLCLPAREQRIQEVPHQWFACFAALADESSSPRRP